MKQYLKIKDMGLISKLLASFDNDTKGFSARKLSAFIAVAISVYATIHYVDSTNTISALKVWLLFALLCLGIITAEQLIKIKSNSTTQTKSKTEEITTEVIQNNDVSQTTTEEPK